MIEHSKEGYYLALRQTQGTIRTYAPNWQPWVLFFLRALQQQMKRLAKKVDREKIVLSEQEISRISSSKAAFWALVSYSHLQPDAAKASGATEAQRSFSCATAASSAAACLLKHLLLALEEFRSLGIQFVSYQENIDTSSPLGQALFTIVSAVAQLERDLIRERVTAGVRNARACGKELGRPRRIVNQEDTHPATVDSMPLGAGASVSGNL